MCKTVPDQDRIMERMDLLHQRLYDVVRSGKMEEGPLLSITEEAKMILRMTGVEEPASQPQRLDGQPEVETRVFPSAEERLLLLDALLKLERKAQVAAMQSNHFILGNHLFAIIKTVQKLCQRCKDQLHK